jgi:RHS repeat-associated protein
LTRVVNPGGATADFGYDTLGRLTQIRDPLANDALAYNRRPTDCPPTASSTPACATVISYLAASSQVLSVTQPAPTAGAPRPRRTYSIDTDNRRAWANLDGFAPASGFATRVEWDSQGRVVRQEDPAGLLTQTTWDPHVDRPLRSVDPAGVQTTDVYDPLTNQLTDRYGPAPSSCFATGFPYTPAGGCPVTVPRTQRRYDENINALAATFWDNPWFAGPPALHRTGPGGTGPAGPGCSADTFCTQWSTLPVTPSGVTRPSCCAWTTNSPLTWSMRLTGVVNLPTPSRLMAATTQRVIVYVNDVLHYDMDAPVANEDYLGAYGEWADGIWPNPPVIPAGRHRIRVDFLGSSTTLNGLWFHGGGTGFLANSALSPDHGLETTSIDPDGRTTATSYSGGGVGPEHGLPHRVTQDPAGLDLTTTTTYENAASGRWLRKTSQTLPGGSTTAYTYYCSRPGAADCDHTQIRAALAPACGVSPAAPQHGLLARRVDPDTSPATQGRAEEFLYNDAGLVVGRRVGPAETIASAPWQCTSYDTRGRITSQTWPTLSASQPGRTVTYRHLVGNDPLTAAVTDNNGTITATVDLLGRPTHYTDTTARVSTYTYDQPGRLRATAGPDSTTTNSYDPNTGRLATVAVAGPTWLSRLTATVGYGAGGRMSTVTYHGAGSAITKHLTVGYDAHGNRTGLTFTNSAGPGPARIAGHQVTMTPGGRQRAALIETGAAALTDPNPGGDDFIYDGAGRLVRAHLSGGRADYGYDPYPFGINCAALHPGANPAAADNTNRAALTWSPTAGNPTTTHYCYNHADQLVGTITDGAPAGGFNYDGRGNQIADGPDSYHWDAADRLAGLTTSTGAVAYTRDALDRLVSRTEGNTTTRYTYTGYSDTPAATLTQTGGTLEELHHLPGGVLVTTDHTTSTNTWSFPNLNGHYVTTTDNNGNRIGNVVTYDPWGTEHPSGAPGIDNTTSGTDLGPYGTHGKFTERTAATPLITMGARPLAPTRARFLTIDPIEGGCANPYVYVFGDPVNTSDLSGRARDCRGFSVTNQYGTFDGWTDSSGYRWTFASGYEPGFGISPVTGEMGSAISFSWGTHVNGKFHPGGSGRSDGLAPTAPPNHRQVGGRVGLIVAPSNNAGTRVRTISVTIFVSYFDPHGGFGTAQVTVSCRYL